jgi:plastocyanin
LSKRLLPGLSSPPYCGTAFPVGRYTNPSSASTDGVVQIAPPPITREWAGRIEDTGAIQLGTVRTFTIASANKKVDWADDHGLSPSRVRTKSGTPVTFTNTSKVAHTIAARDGSWSVGPIKPGESATVAVTRPGAYEYVCKDHPWTIGQLIVE